MALLPCGYTVAESALRKSWLGFKIAHSNSDTGTMIKYASIIRTVQLEMGIHTTKFDSDILEDQDLEYVEYDNEEVQVIDETDLEVNAPDDYDEIMYEAKLSLKGSKPAPRDELFASSADELDQENELEENSMDVKNPDILRNGRRSSLYRPAEKVESESEPFLPDSAGQDQEEEHNLEERIRRSCLFPRKPGSQKWEERIRRSCQHGIKRIANSHEEEGEERRVEDKDNWIKEDNNPDFAVHDLSTTDSEMETENWNEYDADHYDEDNRKNNHEDDFGETSERKSCKYQRK